MPAIGGRAARHVTGLLRLRLVGYDGAEQRGYQRTAKDLDGPGISRRGAVASRQLC